MRPNEMRPSTDVRGDVRSHRRTPPRERGSPGQSRSDFASVAAIASRTLAPVWGDDGHPADGWGKDGWDDDGWKSDGWGGDGHKDYEPTDSPTLSPTLFPTTEPTWTRPKKPVVSWTDDGWKSDGHHGECTTLKHCKDQAAKMGFEEIYFYKGDYSNINVYGCFSKGSKAYWGYGGTLEERTKELSGQKYRIHCKNGGWEKDGWDDDEHWSNDGYRPKCVRGDDDDDDDGVTTLYPLCPHKKNKDKYCDGASDCDDTNYCECVVGRDFCDSGVNPCDDETLSPTLSPTLGSTLEPSRSPTLSPEYFDDVPDLPDDDGTDDTVGKTSTTKTVTQEVVQNASNDFPLMVQKEETQTRCHKKILGDNVCAQECREIKYLFNGHSLAEKEKGPIYYRMCEDAEK